MSVLLSLAALIFSRAAGGLDVIGVAASASVVFTLCITAARPLPRPGAGLKGEAHRDFDKLDLLPTTVAVDCGSLVQRQDENCTAIMMQDCQPLQQSCSRQVRGCSREASLLLQSAWGQILAGPSSNCAPSAPSAAR